MNTRQALVYMTIASLLIPVGRNLYRVMATSAAYSQDRSRGNDETRLVDVVSSISNRPQARVRVVLSKRDTAIIRQHYAPKRRSQPPSLLQKYEGPGQLLPPGWQKEMKPMPLTLERRLRPLPVGYWRGVFEGHAVIYEPGGLISDAAVIF